MKIRHARVSRIEQNTALQARRHQPVSMQDTGMSPAADTVLWQACGATANFECRRKRANAGPIAAPARGCRLKVNNRLPARPAESVRTVHIAVVNRILPCPCPSAGGQGRATARGKA